MCRNLHNTNLSLHIAPPPLMMARHHGNPPLAERMYRLYSLCKPVAVCVFLVVMLYALAGLHYVIFSTPVPVYILDKLHLRHLILPDLTCKSCNNFSYNYIIENKNACLDQDVFLLTFVATFHADVEARNVMRRTWASIREYRGMKLKTLFVFGAHPDSNLHAQAAFEQERYGDVIQMNFSDQYQFLTNKSMAALRWVTQHCAHARFVLKTDDDSFNVPQRFVDYLLNIGDTSFVGGYCFTVLPDRRTGSKFYVSEETYPEHYYPTYCAGPGYIISRDAVSDIVSVASDVRYVSMEDVFVTGMCRQVAGLSYTNIAGVVAGKDEMTSCAMASWIKNAHNIVPGRAAMLWETLKTADESRDCASIHLVYILIFLMFLMMWIKIIHNIFKGR